ncbi:hypothetical protein QR680_006979 [Steinernema hermaphroditum]|uniref:7TM GPCR serpentine receptor class x (Srx) domain-containing protein n=1 Tax=Steinernema hermaphroditum TaxID=289476 RepID=A0AA39LYA2_9BILA|nr:hypothetical protein QR680_006979 [Steinernema hermaphroditum]
MSVLNGNSSIFVYGAELQGRGEPTQKDIIVGSVMFVTLSSASQSKNFKRDTRFFLQTIVQNCTMIVATTMIVVANNEYNLEDEVIRLFGFFTLIVTQVNNGITLLVFNPEVRRRLRGHQVSPTEDSKSKSSLRTRTNKRTSAAQTTQQAHNSNTVPVVTLNSIEM